MNQPVFHGMSYTGFLERCSPVGPEWRMCSLFDIYGLAANMGVLFFSPVSQADH